MALIWCLNTTTTTTSPSTLSLPSCANFLQPYHHHYHYQQVRHRGICAVKTTGSQESYGPELIRKPIISTPATTEEEGGGGKDRWLDWEDQILEDTVPVVGFVRMLLHSGKYQSGERLSPEHETTILERLLQYHPDREKKIGCGIDYITIGYHPQFEESRCLFIVRKDGELEDFSYWKCIKGFIKTNYPEYADTFILKHFHRRRRYD